MPFSSDVSRLAPLVARVWVLTYPEVFGTLKVHEFIRGTSMSKPVGNPWIYPWEPPKETTHEFIRGEVKRGKQE